MGLICNERRDDKFNTEICNKNFKYRFKTFAQNIFNAFQSTFAPNTYTKRKQSEFYTEHKFDIGFFDEDVIKYKKETTLDNANNILFKYLSKTGSNELNYKIKDVVPIHFKVIVFNAPQKIRNILDKQVNFMAEIIASARRLKVDFFDDELKKLISIYLEITKIVESKDFDQKICSVTDVETEMIELIKQSNKCIKETYKRYLEGIESNDENVAAVCVDIKKLLESMAKEERGNKSISEEKNAVNIVDNFSNPQRHLCFDPTSENPFADLIKFIEVVQESKTMQPLFKSIVIEKWDTTSEKIFEKNKEKFKTLFDKVSEFLEGERTEEYRLLELSKQKKFKNL